MFCLCRLNEIHVTLCGNSCCKQRLYTKPGTRVDISRCTLPAGTRVMFVRAHSYFAILADSARIKPAEGAASVVDFCLRRTDTPRNSYFHGGSTVQRWTYDLEVTGSPLSRALLRNNLPQCPRASVSDYYITLHHITIFKVA